MSITNNNNHEPPPWLVLNVIGTSKLDPLLALFLCTVQRARKDARKDPQIYFGTIKSDFTQYKKLKNKIDRDTTKYYEEI